MGRGECDDQMTMRIVAILFSFAGLAMRAGCAPWPVRCFVLALVRQAEAIGRFYAVGAGVPALAPRARRRGSNGLAACANLARRLRTLALLLLVAARRSASMPLLPDDAWPASIKDAFLHAAGGPGHALPFADTS